MITVPSQEIAAFLGTHLDHVLQQAGLDFVQSVAAQRHFKAACSLMDVLNSVQSVQRQLQVVLQERHVSNNPGRGDPASEPRKVRITSLFLLYSLYSSLPIHQNPFLCLFVDIYTTALQNDQHRPERFVISVILNGDGEELAPSTPSELIAIADEVESKRVDLDSLSLFLPEVPIEDQITPGIGWETFEQQKRGGTCDFRKVLERWRKEIAESERNGARKVVTLAGTEGGTKSTSNAGSGTLGTEESATSKRSHNNQQEDDEEELEEWEIEAEKHLQDSNEIAPAPPVKTAQKSKKAAEITYNRQQMNAIMEQAVIQPLSFDQEQFMLSQFTVDATRVHIPLPSQEALPGIVDNNPTIAFNLLLYLIQLSSDLEGGDSVDAAQKSNGAKSSPAKGSAKNSTVASPEPSMVDGYLDMMTRSKRLTLHSLEVVNRLTGATTLSPRFLHGYIENAIRCCEQVEDKVGQARVVRMFCVFLQSLLRSGAITIPGYYLALQSFCVQFSRVKEVANLFQALVEYQRKADAQSPVQVQGAPPPPPPPPPPLTQLTHPPRTLTQSASMPSTPTADTPSRSSWLANSGSISHIKTSLGKHTSMNGFSSPGALSQFIHPGPASPASATSNQNGNHSNGNGNSNSNNISFFKTHQKHSSQHSSSSGSLFSSPTVMSASVNAFNSGLGNPTTLSLNSSNLGSFQAGGPRSAGVASGLHMSRDYDLDAALRESLRDMEIQGGSSSGTGSGPASRTSRTPNNGLQQPIHLGPKGLSNGSHLGNHARGRDSRRGG
ncbi:hypothetical protein BGZ96_002999 [Linnemannia gamsii]|uniref:CCR4-NOT transcription complex subunit 11 n=1 Tax=Linnemannia gamsii TaxID=64522 RepID=A0ABQ7JJT8_9FUNG|nr:hypothetical protein BGZ96_002999 [Linnemannia gamsii]